MEGRGAEWRGGSRGRGGGVEWRGGEQREERGSRVEGRGAEGGEGE